MSIDLFQASPGDANGDGRFDSSDLVQVLQAGRYGSGQPADWMQGDWDGDLVFNQRDIVAALQTGKYLQGPTAAVLEKGIGEVMAKDVPVQEFELVDAALAEEWL